jgi:hypothetical protein
MILRKKIKDISKVDKISIHRNIENDPDLSRAYYFIMKYFRRTKIVPLREATIIVKNIFELLEAILAQSKNWVDEVYLQRMFREIYKVLKYKFGFFK